MQDDTRYLTGRARRDGEPIMTLSTPFVCADGPCPSPWRAPVQSKAHSAALGIRSLEEVVRRMMHGLGITRACALAGIRRAERSGAVRRVSACARVGYVAVDGDGRPAGYGVCRDAACAQAARMAMVFGESVEVAAVQAITAARYADAHTGVNSVASLPAFAAEREKS